MSEFEQLHPSLQYHVVNTLGWSTLRPTQLAAIAPIHAGTHCLLLAPTAGGKTEAAAIPILSRMLVEAWPGTSVLYVCPIKALLNNLEPRLSHYAGLVGRRVEVWHGDISQSRKNRALKDAPDMAARCRLPKLSRAALAQRLSLPEIRLGGMLSAVRRMLNVDQAPVLVIDEAAGTVELNIALLHQQFRVGGPGGQR